MEALITRELERVLAMAEDELVDTAALELPEVIQRALDFPDEMERVLRPPARTYVRRAKAFLRTPADIYEYPDSYSFVLDMPGLEPDMIKVNVEGGKVLHVVGKRRKKQQAHEQQKVAAAEAPGGSEAAAAAAVEEGKPIRIERKRARYMRRFHLPRDADGEKVRATYRNGVLTVEVGKVPPAKELPPKPRSIAVPVS